MKGLTHFWTGVCVATFFPLVVRAAYISDQILWVLLIPIGGLFGYLPDFLDFKFSRYMESEDYTITPGYHELDPWVVAEKLAEAINKAYTSEKPVRVKLQTIRLPQGMWRRYSILFKTEEKEVRVKIGPLITTGLEVLKGTEPKPEKIASVKYKPNLQYGYESVTNVDIWDGPTFQFRRDGEVIKADFIQWHRRWSHSLTLGVFLGLLSALVAGLGFMIADNPLSDAEILTIFGVITGGVWGHVIVDQLGWLGSNLWWPITGERKQGMGLTRSMDPMANFLTMFILTMLILWNLNSYAPEPVFSWTALEFFLYYFTFPITLLVTLSIVFRKKSDEGPKSRDVEMLEEVSKEISEF